MRKFRDRNIELVIERRWSNDLELYMIVACLRMLGSVKEGTVVEVFELDYGEVLGNIELLEEKKGKLYDEELEVSYSILTDDFLVIIQEGMIFWSSKRKLAFEWAEKLKENGLSFFEPSFIGKEDGEEDFWENKTKINSVWVDDNFGEVRG